jgi:thiosulfate/3-mercaptopyruvate sulfurtransferase
MTVRKRFQHIGVDQAITLIEHRDPTIFDVRARDAYTIVHIGGARHLTVTNLSDFIAHMAETSPILIYCYHGYASQEYAQVFSDFGFVEVYSLDGGFEAWRKADTAANKTVSSEAPQTGSASSKRSLRIRTTTGRSTAMRHA